jgi:hypothetical protein
MSLFTFNSDIKVEEVATSTRLSLISFMIAAIAIIAGLVTIDLIKPQLLSRDENNLLLRDKKDIEIIILGDSTERAIDPGGISGDCLNLAFGASGYTAWEPIFTSAIRNFPNLKTLIISGDPMSILRDGIGLRNGDFKDILRLGGRVSDIPGLSMAVRLENYIRYESIICDVISGPKLSWDGVSKIPKHFGWRPKKKKGHFTYRPNEGRQKKLSYSRVFEDAFHLSENRSALGRMLVLARDVKLSVILIRTPVTEDFFTVNQESWEKLAGEIVHFTESIIPPNCVKIIDYSNDPRFLLKDFADPNHLTIDARREFTRMISPPIKEFGTKRICYVAGDMD